MVAVRLRPAAVVAATKEGITITSDNPGLGEVREDLENYEPLAIGFNPKYVVELLMQMTSDQITIAAQWRARTPGSCAS